jgi:hypothetical protein
VNKRTIIIMPDSDHESDGSGTVRKDASSHRVSARAKKPTSKASAAKKLSTRPAVGKKQGKKRQTGLQSVNMMLMNNAKAMDGKDGMAAAGGTSRGGRSKCWCHPHFIAQDEQGAWKVPVTEDNFQQLSRSKAKLVCSFCMRSAKQKHEQAQKESASSTPFDYSSLHVFSWDPSTTRRDHLMLACPAFKLSPFFTDTRVKASLDTYYEAKAKTANVRLTSLFTMCCALFHDFVWFMVDVFCVGLQHCHSPEGWRKAH